MDYSKSETNIKGEFGEKLFHRHGNVFLKRLFSKEPCITEWHRIEGHPEFQRLTDMDAISQEESTERRNELVQHGMSPSHTHEIKTEYRCFQKDEATGNICLETISNKNRYATGRAEKGELFGGIECSKRNGTGWMFAKTGITADWWHFALVIGEGTDATIAPEALEAWKHDDRVPDDTFIITKAKPEALFVSIIEKKLEEFANRGKIKEFSYKELILVKVEDVMNEMTILWKPQEFDEAPNYAPPRSCTRYDIKANYYAPYISDEDKAKYFDERIEKTETDKHTLIPIMMITGIFKAQKKSGEETEIALYGNEDKNKNVYVAPEIRAAIEDFYGMKEEYPCTCEVCKSMIRGTQWV